MKATPLQIEMIVKIAEDDYTPVNGCEPEAREDAMTFINMVVNTNQDKGVLTSLINAGLVETCMFATSPNESTVELTEAGFSVYKSFKRGAV